MAIPSVRSSGQIPSLTASATEAKLAQVDGPPSLKEKLDGYFELIRRGLVKGISIGFRPLEMEPIETGWLIKTWELLEASVVTIPANASCSIDSVKALAKTRSSAVSLRSPPGHISVAEHQRRARQLEAHQWHGLVPPKSLRSPPGHISVAEHEKRRRRLNSQLIECGMAPRRGTVVKASKRQPVVKLGRR